MQVNLLAEGYHDLMAKQLDELQPAIGTPLPGACPPEQTQAGCKLSHRSSCSIYASQVLSCFQHCGEQLDRLQSLDKAPYTADHLCRQG